MDKMTRAYLECAIWTATTDDRGTPMDRDYDADDLSPETIQEAEQDCNNFRLYVRDHDGDDVADLIDADPEQTGHDFWLTRNHHGAGFWDGDWPKAAGKILTDAAHTFGSCDLYIGDDGKIYSQ